ncbi:MAG: hypothetical protein WAJ85_08935 [Candidatus Baltobacteraceae bacterium]|jgi:hypothetical protein
MTLARLAGLIGAGGLLTFVFGVTLGLVRLLSLVERDAIASGVTSER